MNSTTIGESENLIIDPESEIKKLQELVKKLETQNQQLIMRHNGGGGTSPPTHQPKGNDVAASDAPVNQPPPQVLRQINGVRSSALHDPTTTAIHEKQVLVVDRPEKPKADVSRLTLDGVGLVDVDRISLDADDSWLYKSPKQTPGYETKKSPFLWVREEFDKSTDDASSFRKALLDKLDEVTRNVDVINALREKKTPSKLSEDSKMKFSLVNDKDVFSEADVVAPLGKAGKARPSPAIQRAEHLSENNLSDDVNTKNLDPLVQPSLSTRKDRRVSESSISDTGGHNRTVNSVSEENLLGTKYKRVDVADIKVLAKMQEESLRMSYNVPLGSSKKLLSKSLNRSSGALVNSCDSLPANAALSKDLKGLNQSSGALLETTNFTVSSSKIDRSDKPQFSNENRAVSKSATSLARPAPRNAAVRSGLPKATASNSLPGTPYGSKQELSKRVLSTASNAVPHRQSMPTLNQGLKLSVLKSHPSDSRLTVTGMKPLSLLRPPTSSTSSKSTPVRGARVATPVKPKSSTVMTSGSRTISMSMAGRSTTVTPSASAKSRPSTLSNCGTRPVRAIMTNGRTTPGATTPVATTPGAKMPGATTPGAKTPGAGATTSGAKMPGATTTGAKMPGATTPTSKSRPLAASSNKPSSPSTLSRMSGIPKPGSLTKLSIPCKTTMQAGRATMTANNDDDDWKEGCF